jgi:hypothetical protein
MNTKSAGATRALALAATPTFAIMGLLSVGQVEPAEMLCGHPFGLGGMGTMYLLMSGFHAGPWLRLTAAAFARLCFALAQRRCRP